MRRDTVLAAAVAVAALPLLLGLPAPHNPALLDSMDELEVSSAQSTLPRPPARGFHAMAYDSESDRIILFGGGGDGNDWGDTWAYDLNTNTWTKMAPATSPPASGAMEMAYDAESDRMVLIGGCTNVAGCDFNETWVYDYNSDMWTRRIPPSAPPPRHALRGAYDAESDRVVVVGGHQGTGGTMMRDTWAYDFNTNAWTNETPPGFGWASYASVAYDAESDRIVHFAGERDAGFVTATWAYDYNTDTWTDRNPAVQPPAPQWIQDMDYDSESDRIVLFGSRLDEGATWSYDYNANAWEDMAPALQPEERHAQQFTYDADSDRLVLFGGCLDLLALCVNDTWAYDLNANVWSVMIPAPPFQPLNLVATGGEGRVDLTWDPPAFDGSSPITAYRIYRRTSGELLSFLDEVGSTPGYTDTNVTGGTQYFYQVTAVTAGGEGDFSGQDFATPSVDVTDPTIAITSPSRGATVPSTPITVMGTATDNAGVARVEISTDQSTWILAEGTSDWSGSLALEQGANTIYARATDVAGNEATTSIPVTYTPPQPGIDPVVVAVAVGAVGAAAAIAGVLLLRRQRKR